LIVGHNSTLRAQLDKYAAVDDQVHHQLAGTITSVESPSPVSIQTQSLALRALRKRKPQETQALALTNSQSWLPLLRPSIPIG